MFCLEALPRLGFSFLPSSHIPACSSLHRLRGGASQSQRWESKGKPGFTSWKRDVTSWVSTGKVGDFLTWQEPGVGCPEWASTWGSWWGWSFFPSPKLVWLDIQALCCVPSKKKWRVEWKPLKCIIGYLFEVILIFFKCNHSQCKLHFHLIPGIF